MSVYRAGIEIDFRPGLENYYHPGIKQVRSISYLCATVGLLIESYPISPPLASALPRSVSNGRLSPVSSRSTQASQLVRSIL